ncbi:MAG: hypothetical protein IJU66_06615 [Oscillospiraceae bacterium]|nr:hypothetical protein [Oscillospiraceae bacterium]
MAAGDKIKVVNADFIAKEYPSGHTYQVGRYFFYNAKLYRATDTISFGARPIPGQNCEEAALGSELYSEIKLSELALGFSCENMIARIEREDAASRAYDAGEYFLREGIVAGSDATFLKKSYSVYRATRNIAQGERITPGSNCEAVTLSNQLNALDAAVAMRSPLVGKGINLLDNAYFIGGGGNGQFPINQRETSSYSTEGEFIFDRWKLVSGSAVLVSGGVTLNGTIQQTREQSIGQTVVASALCSDGTMLTPTYNDSTKVFTLTASGKTIVAAKLEIGTQQTLAHMENGVWVLNDAPPDYQQELAKCQRHYFRRKYPQYATIGNYYSEGSWLNLSFGVGTPMSSNDPTVKITGTLGVIGAASGVSLGSTPQASLAGCAANLGFSVPNVPTGAGYIYAGTDNLTIELTAQ